MVLFPEDGKGRSVRNICESVFMAEGSRTPLPSSIMKLPCVDHRRLRNSCGPRTQLHRAGMCYHCGRPAC